MCKTRRLAVGRCNPTTARGSDTAPGRRPAARCGGSGPCGRPIRSATDGNVTLYSSSALLAELRAVPGRAHLAVRLRRQNASVDEAMTLYGALAINVSPTALPRVVAADADDDQVVAAAVAATADLIVSGDRHLLDIGQPPGYSHHDADRGRAAVGWARRCRGAGSGRRGSNGQVSTPDRFVIGAEVRQQTHRIPISCALQ